MGIKLLRRLGFVALALAAFGCQKKSGPLHEGEPVSNLEDAVRYAPGTWTHTAPLSPDEFQLLSEMGRNLGASFSDEKYKKLMDMPDAGWSRFILKDGGFGQRYFALPAYSSWGDPQNCKWKTASNKYADTGSRYYSILISCGDREYEMVFQDSQHLLVTGMGLSNSKILEKGDRNPFSQ